MSHDQLMDEILAAHAERLRENAPDASAYLSLFPEDRDELSSLFAVAERTRQALPRVAPSHQFRRELGRSLHGAARQRVIANSLASNRAGSRSLETVERWIWRDAPRLQSRAAHFPWHLLIPIGGLVVALAIRTRRQSRGRPLLPVASAR